MNKNSVIILNALPDKKVKSIGNRCLVRIKKNKNIFDYHIQSIKKIFKNPEIIFVCGFDSKKIKRYIDSKYSNIIFIEHAVDDTTNIGTSLEMAINKISTNSCLIINANHVLHKQAIDKIRLSLDHSFILTSNTKGEVGFIKNNNFIENCYYDLPNQIYDIFYIEEKELAIAKSIKNLSKLYLFEIINRYIEYGMKIKPLQIANKSITIINSAKNIENIRKKLCIN